MHHTTAAARRVEPLDRASLALLGRIPILAPLAALPAAETALHVTTRRHAAGEFLYRQGEPADLVYAIAAGGVVLSATAHEGASPIVVDILRVGTCLGEEAVLGLKRLASAQALPGTRLLAVNAAVLRGDDRSVMHHLYARLSSMTTEMAAVKSIAPAQRLARLLMSLAEESDGPAVIPAPPRHKTMADWLGVRPETFSARVVPKLKSLGVDFRAERIAIADMAVLAEFARTHSSMKGCR